MRYHRSPVTLAGALLLVLPMIAGPALAQAPPPAQPALTLAQAVQAALARNPQVAAARQALAAAQQNVTVARAGMAPTVSLAGTGGLGTPSASSSVGQQGAPFASPTASGTLSVSGSVPLYDSGRTRVAVEQAEAQVAQAEAALRQTEQDLALQAATAFYNVLRAERLADVQQAQLAQAQAQLALTQAQVRAGVAPQSDVIQAQAQVAQAQVNLLAARAQISTAKAALQSVIAADVAAPIEVQAPPGPAAQVGVTADAVLAAAEAHRPEIAKAQATIQASQASLDQAYIEAGPQIAVSAGAGYTPISTSPALSNTTSYGLTATVSLPLYDAGKGQAGINAAQASLRSAQAQLEAARAAVRQDAYQAYLNAVQAAANLTATRAAQTAADNALRVAEGRYRAGVGTIVEVITARAQAVQAEVNATTAVYDYATALATLRHAEGEPIVAGVQGGQA